MKDDTKLDPLRNGHDPLRKANNANGIELFRRLSGAAHGFPVDAVIVGAINLLINAVRSGNASRVCAESAFDEYMLKAKGVLLDQHYDHLGRRRSVFPYDQVIDVPLINLRRDKG